MELGRGQTALTRAQIDQIAASIREFGWTNPILVDAKGTIIAGHGRLAAATRLGLDQVPVIRLGHLSDAQRKALVIADNQLALNAGWDEVALSNLVRELDAEKFELDLLGFDSADLDRYLAGLNGDAAAEAEEAELPEVPVVPTSRPGDLWILGNHRLLCGDATSAADVRRLYFQDYQRQWDALLADIARAGADTFVAGSAVFGAGKDGDPHRYDSIIAALRGELARVAT